MICHPSIGGCWFCYTDDDNGLWLFSQEFDTYLHENCFKKELKLVRKTVWDKELEIIARELGYEYG